jgi:hypothetical protein
MTTIGALIGHQGRKQLAAVATHPRKIGVHQRLIQLGDTIILYRTDGSKVSRTAESHWPPDEWATITKALFAREYICTKAGEVVFTE